MDETDDDCEVVIKTVHCCYNCANYVGYKDACSRLDTNTFPDKFCKLWKRKSTIEYTCLTCLHSLWWKRDAVTREIRCKCSLMEAESTELKTRFTCEFFEEV